MRHLYCHIERKYAFGEDNYVNVFDPAPGEKYDGFTVLDGDDDGIRLLLDPSVCPEGAIEVVVPFDKILHFENMREESYEIYGDEYSETVGASLTVGYGVFFVNLNLDTLYMAGISAENSIRVTRADEEGNPQCRTTIIMLDEVTNPIDKKVNKYTKKFFLEKYNAWMSGDCRLSFLDKYESHEEAYLMKQMINTSLTEAADCAFKEAHENDVAQHIIDESLNGFSAIGLSYARYAGRFIHTEVSFPGKNGVWYFEDNTDSIFTDRPKGGEHCVYNADILNSGRYNMIIAMLSSLTDAEVPAIHREIVTRIFDGVDIQEYLDSLGFPIIVYYNKAHYDRLTPTFSKNRGRSIGVTVTYKERGHNERGEARDVSCKVTFEATAGYHNIIRDIGITDYPRRNDYIKIEEIGDLGLSVRVPYFFDSFCKCSRLDESEEPHSLVMDEILIFDKEKEVTCHKYRWYSELTVSLARLDDGD